MTAPPRQCLRPSELRGIGVVRAGHRTARGGSRSDDADLDGATILVCKTNGSLWTPLFMLACGAGHRHGRQMSQRRHRRPRSRCTAHQPRHGDTTSRGCHLTVDGANGPWRSPPPGTPHIARPSEISTVPAGVYAQRDRPCGSRFAGARADHARDPELACDEIAPWLIAPPMFEHERRGEDHRGRPPGSSCGDETSPSRLVRHRRDRRSDARPSTTPGLTAGRPITPRRCLTGRRSARGSGMPCQKVGRSILRRGPRAAPRRPAASARSGRGGRPHLVDVS